MRSISSKAQNPRNRFLAGSILVHAEDHAPAPQELLEPLAGGHALRRGGPLAQVVGVRGERRHERAVPVSTPMSSQHARKLASQRTVWKSARGGGRHALEDLACHRRGQHPQRVGAGEGRVGEVDGVEVGPLFGEQSGQEAEVVVLHQDGRPVGGGGVHDRREEQLVELAVGLPGPGPVVVEAWSPGQVEEVMVQEPQRGVRHDVVGHAVDVAVGLHGEQVQPALGHEPFGGRLAIGVGHGARHPGRPAPLELGMQRGGQPARGAGGHGTAVVVQRDESGPRFETMTRSAFKGNRPLSYADDPTPRLRGTLRRATMAPVPGPTPEDGPVPDDDSARPASLAAPDAFKGTAGAPAVAAAMDRGARRAGWGCDPCPLSDGGEGFAEVLAQRRPPSEGSSGSWHRTQVTGPLGEAVVASWWLADGVAVVESAAASGLPLAGGPEGNDPLRATTRGTGELLVAAAAAGARRVLVGVGGSATTDGGRGALDAIEAAGGLGASRWSWPVTWRRASWRPPSGSGPRRGRRRPRSSSSGTAWPPGRRPAGALRRRRTACSGAAAPPGSPVGWPPSAPGSCRASAWWRSPSGFSIASPVSGSSSPGKAAWTLSSWSGKVVGGVVGSARRVGVPVLVVAGAVGPGGIDPRPWARTWR